MDSARADDKVRIIEQGFLGCLSRRNRQFCVFDFATLSSGWIERTIVIDSEYFGHLVLAIEQFETGIH
jgi:hypothetical protein